MGDQSTTADAGLNELLSNLALIKTELVIMKAQMGVAPKIREVAERAASLAAKIKEGGAIDQSKMASEVEALMAILNGVIEKYPSPVSKNSGAEPPVEVEKAKDAGAILAKVAEEAMALAAKLEEGKDMDPGMMAKAVQGLLAMLAGLPAYPPPSEAYPDPTQKSKEASLSVQLQELAKALYAVACDVEDQKQSVYAAISVVKEIWETKASALEAAGFVPSTEDTKLADALYGADEAAKVAEFSAVLRSTIAKAGSSAAVMQPEQPLDEHQKKDVQFVGDTLKALIAAVPTQERRAEDALASTVQAIADKATKLAESAAELKYEDSEGLAELAKARSILDTLVTKYVTVKKAQCTAEDLQALFGANSIMEQLNLGLSKLGYIKKEEVTNLESAPPASTVPATSVAQEPDAKLMARLESLTEQVKQIQTIISKSTGGIPAPAAAGQAEGESSAEHSFPACQDDYNDPAYRAQLKALGYK